MRSWNWIVAACESTTGGLSAISFVVCSDMSRRTARFYLCRTCQCFIFCANGETQRDGIICGRAIRPFKTTRIWSTKQRTIHLRSSSSLPGIRWFQSHLRSSIMCVANIATPETLASWRCTFRDRLHLDRCSNFFRLLRVRRALGEFETRLCRFPISDAQIPFKTAYRRQSLTALSEDEIREMVAALEVLSTVDNAPEPF
jgi:hypothetical protein